MIRHGSARVAWLIAIAVVLMSLAIGESASVAAEKARVIVRGPTTHKTIALTIDDGYDAKHCHEIYNTLVRFRIPATWFPNAVHVRDVESDLAADRGALRDRQPYDPPPVTAEPLVTGDPQGDLDRRADRRSRDRSGDESRSCDRRTARTTIVCSERPDASGMTSSRCGT